jgi:predicted ester cyclase
MRWTAKATHQGEFLGIKPTRKELHVAGMTILRIENGQVAEAWDGYDALGLMQQLGVIP